LDLSEAKKNRLSAVETSLESKNQESPL